MKNSTKRTITLLASMVLACGLQAQDFPIMDGTVNQLKKGDNLFEKGSYVKALKAYEKGYEKKKEDSSSYLIKLAETNRLLDNYEEALQYYAKAKIDDPNVRKNYAEVLAATSNYEAATKELNKSVGTTSNEVVEERKKGFEKVKEFYEDSLAYAVNEVSFNSSEREFSVFLVEKEVAFVSSRKRDRGLFNSIDEREETDFLNLYTNSNEGVKPMASINSSLNQGPSTFMKDQGILLVTSNFQKSNKNSDRNDPTNLRIVSYTKSENEWKEQGILSFGNAKYSTGHPTFDDQRGILYFASNRPGGYGGVDLYKSFYKGDTWSEPVNLGPEINTQADDYFPFIHADQNILYFSSDGYGGLGGLDVYKVDMADPTSVMNLGYPVNSSKDDFGFILKSGGKEGYLSSNRDGGSGKDDIYNVYIYSVRIKSKLIDLNTGVSMVGKMKIIERSTGREIPYTVDGDVVIFDGIEGEEYQLIGSKEGYESNALSISVNEKTKDQVVELPISEKPKVEFVSIVMDNLVDPKKYKISDEGLIEIESVATKPTTEYTIKNIFFDYNSSAPKASKEVVDNLVSILNDYPELQLEITSYADSRGSKEYNQKLAKRRADEVIKEFLARGIEAERISSVAIGESILFNECHESTECSEKEHELNRRVEFLLK